MVCRGSIIPEDGELIKVTNKIKIGWVKWGRAFVVLCDRRIPLRLKGKLYKIVVKPVMIYKSECWALKNNILKRCA